LTIYSAAVIVLLAFVFLSLFAFAKRKLDFPFVIFWLVLSGILVIVSSKIDWLEKVANALSIFYAPSLLFAAALTFVLAFIFYITIFITEITKKIVRLTQEVGILKKKVEEYENSAKQHN